MYWEICIPSNRCQFYIHLLWYRRKYNSLDDKGSPAFWCETMQSGQKPYNMTYYIYFFFIFRSIILLIYIVTSPPPFQKKKTTTKTNQKKPQNQLNKKKTQLHIAVRMMRGREYLLVSLYFNVDFVWNKGKSQSMWYLEMSSTCETVIEQACESRHGLSTPCPFCSGPGPSCLYQTPVLWWFISIPHPINEIKF